MRNHLLRVGDPAPWFKGHIGNNEKFRFDTLAGRFIVLGFLGSLQDPDSKQFIETVTSNRHYFSDNHLIFVGVTTDETDKTNDLLKYKTTKVRFLRDFDSTVSKLYGAVNSDGQYRKVVYIIDPMLRIYSILPHTQDGFDISKFIKTITNIPELKPQRKANIQAPILVLRRIFEPEFCRKLIDYYNKHGGSDSGFMQDIDGKTVGIIDHNYKSRRDCTIFDDSLIKACKLRIKKRLMPEIQKVFQFPATQMERFIIACYDANDHGFFSAHRDNTTIATTHRKFAISLFLNSDFEGGQLKFPEYGQELYSAPAGGAVVFSCSLLHEATVVTKGCRYMFLPFIYDDAGHETRLNTEQFINPKKIIRASKKSLAEEKSSGMSQIKNEI